ncbi:four and a half LIM domains protein 2-like protein [Anopheles sinensis]|uniref:Four and a half LIM domains protein 2-like protein n=1 Tax=Anopheles sinensis TaxID=74873 RepID=A0A084W4K9_ANOSI|nr:four and a half LIM domains protein 2-like protein [Anopheles sinensis]
MVREQCVPTTRDRGFTFKHEPFHYRSAVIWRGGIQLRGRGIDREDGSGSDKPVTMLTDALLLQLFPPTVDGHSST